MRTRFVITILVVLALYGVMAGCKNDPEQQRSVVTVASLNCNSPGFSDVLEQGDSLSTAADDFRTEDWIQVFFYNRPYNHLVATDPGMPHGDFLITHYIIEWTRSDGGTPLPAREERTSINVPSGEIVGGWLRLVSGAEKLDPIVADLCYTCPSFPQVVFMTANITFFGHESGTDRETEIEAQLTVEFADYVIETDEKEEVQECTLKASG